MKVASQVKNFNFQSFKQWKLFFLSVEQYVLFFGMKLFEEKELNKINNIKNNSMGFE